MTAPRRIARARSGFRAPLRLRGQTRRLGLWGQTRWLGLIVILLTLSGPGVGAAAVAPRASLTDIENDVMCVACHESLAVAQSPAAISERDYIRGLIAQGMTKDQIEKNLVAELGPSVLGRPPASGFSLVVYVVPPVLVALGVLALVITIPRWRRRARVATGRPLGGRSLDPAEARRLDEDLARQL